MTKKTNEVYNFLDELIHITIHEHEYKRLPKAVKAFVDENRDLEFYPKSGREEYKKRHGKEFNRVEEFKRVVKEYIEEIKNNKGAESNVECMMLDQMVELLKKMMAYEVRQLDLGKLIKGTKPCQKTKKKLK